MIGGMIMLFLFNSVTVNILVTIAIVLFVIFIFYLESKYIKKKGDDITKFQLFVLYLSLFILIIAGIALGFYTWDFNFFAYVDSIWDDAIAFILEKIGDLILTVFIIFFVSFFLRFAKMLLKKSALKQGPNQKRKITMLKVTKSLLNYTVKLIALLVILAIWGVNVLPALTGLGILGLVVGLGAQSLIKDLIAGFFIIFEKHFDVGDTVEINGFKGKVIDVGLKTTKVQNWKNEVKTFNNGNINESTNFSRNTSVAAVEFGVAYGEDIQKVIDILNQELPKFKEIYPNIIENPFVVGVTELANSSVNIRVMAKTETETQYGIERALRLGIKEILDKHGIEIPFPQVVVHQPKK